MLQNDVGPERLVMGEASPSYLSDTNAAQRIKVATPDAKVIFSLRNPSLRAVSHYFHEVKRVGDEPRSPEEAFSEENIERVSTIFKEEGYDLDSLQDHEFWPTLRYFTEGLYSVYLRKWIEVIPSSNLLILNYHQLESEPDAFVNEMFGFVGLAVPEGFEVTKVFANEYPELPTALLARLDQFFLPYNQELAEMLGVNDPWF